MKKLLVGLLVLGSLSSHSKTLVNDYDEVTNIPDDSIQLSVKKDLFFLARDKWQRIGERCAIYLKEKLPNESKVSENNIVKIGKISRTQDSTAYNYYLTVKNYRNIDYISCHSDSKITVGQLKKRIESEYFDMKIESNPIELD